MRITKLQHSCIVIEANGKKAIADPGCYSWQSGLVDENILEGVDYVCVTHEHPDHFDAEFALAIQKTSPNAVWFSVPGVCEQLKELGIVAVSSSSTSDVLFVQSDHANLAPWYSGQPEHTSFKIFGDILVSGDHQNHAHDEGARILAGAFNGGPWGAAIGTVSMLKDMNPRPKIYIPLHDWHLKGEARKGFYDRASEVCVELGIEFVKIESGIPVEL